MESKTYSETKEKKTTDNGGTIVTIQQTYKSNPFFGRTLHPILESKENSFWTQPTHILCWYCSGSFPNPPFPLPTGYNNGIFTSMGVYCSLTCVKSHIKEYGGYFMGQRLEWLTLMAADVFNYHDEIKTIDKYRFEHFGGDLKHSEYLQKKAIVPTIHLRSIPFVDAPFVFEQPFKDEEISKMHINPIMPTSSVQTLTAPAMASISLLSSGSGSASGSGPIAASGLGSGSGSGVGTDHHMSDIGPDAPGLGLGSTNNTFTENNGVNSNINNNSSRNGPTNFGVDSKMGDNSKKPPNANATKSKTQKRKPSESPSGGSSKATKKRKHKAAAEIPVPLGATLAPLSASGSKKINSLLQLMNIQ